MNESEEQRSMGKGMIIAAWVAALALMTLLFNGILDHQQNPNRSPVSGPGEGGTVETILKRNRAGHYVASGAINGVPVVFLVDTGATDVALPLRVANKIGLPLGARSIARTAGGDVTVRTTRLDRVALGAIQLYDIPASVLDKMEGEEVLLGMSFLKHLELIQQGERMTLRQYR